MRCLAVDLRRNANGELPRTVTRSLARPICLSMSLPDGATHAIMFVRDRPCRLLLLAATSRGQPSCCWCPLLCRARARVACPVVSARTTIIQLWLGTQLRTTVELATAVCSSARSRSPRALWPPSLSLSLSLSHTRSRSRLSSYRYIMVDTARIDPAPHATRLVVSSSSRLA